MWKERERRGETNNNHPYMRNLLNRRYNHSLKT